MCFLFFFQTELNCREGAWERLCVERNPLLLSALMWSWLEQLKEPVITKEDVESLSQNRQNPLQALSIMDKVKEKHGTNIDTLQDEISPSHINRNFFLTMVVQKTKVG